MKIFGLFLLVFSQMAFADISCQSIYTSLDGRETYADVQLGVLKAHGDILSTSINDYEISVEYVNSAGRDFILGEIRSENFSNVSSMSKPLKQYGSSMYHSNSTGQYNIVCRLL